MKLFFGLGNPGKKYEHTRHNLGERVLKSWQTSPDISLLFPSTFMNDSGKALGDFLKENPIDTKNILLIHDDIELPFGEIKFTEGGSAKGHKGVRSIHEALGTQDIPRLRLGIGRPPEGAAVDQFVLDKFTNEEENNMQPILDKAQEMLTNISNSDIMIDPS